jgi:hypothetical protein
MRLIYYLLIDDNWLLGVVMMKREVARIVLKDADEPKPLPMGISEWI